jgi:hypothetical protein
MMAKMVLMKLELNVLRSNFNESSRRSNRSRMNPPLVVRGSSLGAQDRS